MKPVSNTLTLTPKLRFPEFRRAKGWVIFPLAMLLDYERPDAYIVSSTDYKATGTPVLTANKSFVLGYTNETTGIYENTPVIIFDDFTTDKKYVDFPFKVKSSAIKILTRKRDDNLRLIFELMGGIRFEPKEHKRYYISAYQNLEIALPRPPEQHRIATCLSSLDNLIGSESRKLDALKAHKKGLMQHLFPREGESVPRLRFPEFRKAGEWETKAGGVLFTNRKEDGEEGLPIYSVTLSDGMIPRASFDRDFNDIEDPAGNKKALKGDIVYNMMRMWQGAQGVAPEDCMVSPAYVVLSPRSGVCSDFFAYLFKLPQSLSLLTATSRGLTKDRLRLYFDDFSRMRLCVPSFKEQRRIAACLSSRDDLIAAQAAKVEALKTHKQGLMQQLFPPSDKNQRH
ncbi:MAG: restriction endonuclease subunit S [Kiritimatiellae bacterium]|nr:restriction endonuclease subunit S [Kiritimatiellia bacterium]MDD4341460.1 restriction endonuclease subunit S [Kiritimatiellia bacterium]